MSGNTKQVASVVAVVVALFFFMGVMHRSCISADRLTMADAKTDEALITHLAQAVGQDQKEGKVVFIRYSGYLPSTKERQEFQANTFKHALPGGDDMVELPPESLPQDAHGSWVLRSAGGDWGGEYKEWMSDNNDAVAVVSIVGVPNLTLEEWESTPPFYASTVVETPYHEELLKRGFLKGLAVVREDADPLAIREFKGSDEELFGMVYEYRTPPTQK